VLTLRVNGKSYQVDAEPATPLLWVLRDNLGLTGTKYGCGIAQCGAQCGYCQSGQIMAVAALLARTKNPSESDINRDITNICRCGTYQRMRTAIRRAAELARG
jgi:aerobic-type carbon monoxide dehydrogenase small subunit (CoxS/CutS family)